jgi:pyrroline-5-carboxylate reductase
MNNTIAFIGAGNMASAIIGGLIDTGYPAQRILAADPYQPSLDSLEKKFAIVTSDDNNRIIGEANIILLAVKPQQMQQVCSDIRQSVEKQNALVISIAAGINCEMLQSWLGANTAIVRCMPNTPALVRCAASGLFANAKVSDTQKQAAHQLLEAVGMVRWVDDEALLDAVTAVSGSGPAYFFLMLEAMQAAGVKLGLDSETAKQLSLQTALGAAKMALASDDEPAELRRKVTSPKGTTEAAIKVFQDNGFSELVEKALSAADARSKSLAKEMLEGKA